MGIASKWIKLLVGIKKQGHAEKLKTEQNAESSETGLHKQRHFMYPESAPLVEEVAMQSEAETSTVDKNTQTISSLVCSDNNDLHLSQTDHDSKENLAATFIQSAFRAFLARRALRALKGIVLLQALIRGHVIRKQTAESFQCMQALVKAQARVRARQVRVALESQAGQKNVPEQDDHDNYVREVEEGWCGSIGSAEEMQAKVLKRQEAAAKRERAMAYALTHQRQAGSRQQKSTSLHGSELDDNHWGSNWVDRWMAVRPWESRQLDNNSKESVTMLEDMQDEGTKSLIGVKGKVAISSTPGLNKKKGVHHKKSYSDVSSTSFVRPTSLLPSTSLGSSKQRAKTSDEVFGEVSSQPTEIASKTRRPKDRVMQVNAPTKKRPSLADNVGEEAGKGPSRRNLMNRSAIPRSNPKIRADAPNQAAVKQVALKA